jgi:hypothetical protein
VKTRYGGPGHEALRSGLAALRAEEAFTVAEFGAVGLTVWEVRRAGNGMPQAERWPAVTVASLLDGGAAVDRRLSQVVASGVRLVFVSSSADERHAELFGRLHGASPGAPVFHSTVPLEEVLRDVIDNDPLTEWYELVVLRRTRSGRLVFQSHPLIPPGAERGYRQDLTVRCEPSDEHGTVFAVVAAEQAGFRLVSVSSVSLDPGVYHLTAELLRPGEVGFAGLPERPRPDHRSWSELVAAVPERLDRRESAHLICAVEVCGTTEQFEERISRIEQLIEGAESADGRLAVSLICYGPHSFDRAVEEPASALAWAGTSDDALSALAGQRERGPVQAGYPYAAQLECALTEVARRLTGREGRPVLVTVGSRPPFPPRVDPRTQILPCPYRRDWRLALGRLRGYPGATFGAIGDHDPDSGIWNQLCSTAFAREDAVDVRRFAAALGLSIDAVQYVPFPLVET